MVPAGNKAKRLSSVNHTRSTIPQKQFIIIITKFVIEQEEHEKEDLQGRTFQ